MPWAVFLLVLANVVVAGYGFFTAPSRVPTDVRALEVNADAVTVVRPLAADTNARPAPERAAKAAPSACLEWGPFAAGELERAQADVAKLGSARSVVRDLGLAPAWWVHVPPLRTREDALRRAREIEDSGVTEVRVVAEGERWRNAISLGIFRTEEAANGYLARMKDAKVRNAAVVQRNDLLRLASLLIVEPPPPWIARLAELRIAYVGTEIRALACPPGVR